MDSRCPSILVVGSINADLVARVARLPVPGETISARDLTTVPGGKGANQAVACARLGAHVSLLAKVGNDGFAAMLGGSLREAGIDTTHVETVEGVSSGLAMIQVDSAGENVITVAAGANARLSPEDVRSAREALASSDAVMVQLEVPLDTVTETIRMAREAGRKVVLDPAPAPTQVLPPSLFDVTLLTPNQSEAEALTGIAVDDLASARRAASRLVARGAAHVVVKLGAAGALLFDASGASQHVESPRVGAVDTTAAGDAFAAAVTVELARGVPLAEAARFACAAGAFAVTRHGAQPAMPTREQVQALLKEAG